MATLVLIAAVAQNGVIGRGADLVFRDPVDQRHFRDVTLGHPVIMGRKTWESLPQKFRPLPGRRNIVVTRSPVFQAPGAEVAGSLDAARALALSAPGTQQVFVIGGGELYAQALPQADEMWLTEVHADRVGDITFPAWPREAFELVSRQAHHAADGTAFAISHYRRRA